MIHTALTEQLTALNSLMLFINDAQYNRKNSFLSNGSIGQHVRHVIELIQCLQNGYSINVVNYDDRKRNLQLETDRPFAMTVLIELVKNIDQPDKMMSLKQQVSDDTIQTTYHRELHYNTEHAIHHMALIKVALKEMNINVADENFGVAPATIQFKKQQVCAQ